MGFLQNVPVQILVDSGSSSSFVNEALVSQLIGIQSDPASSSVQVAGGGMLTSSSVLRHVPWTVDDCTFYSDFISLPLATFDVIVGMDWLEAYSPMQIDWPNKWLAVPYQGQIRVLQGLSPSSPQHTLLRD